MKLIIEGRAEEIAALAAELKGRPEKMIRVGSGFIDTPQISASKGSTTEERKALADTIRAILAEQGKETRMIKSFGFSPSGYNQIIIFLSDGKEFERVLKSNPNMVAILGNDDRTRKEYPGIFIAGIKAEASLQEDSTEGNLSAIRK